jgi:hypothetical protein
VDLEEKAIVSILDTRRNPENPQWSPGSEPDMSFHKNLTKIEK